MDSYHSTLKMSQAERTRSTARRVGLDMPKDISVDDNNDEKRGI